MYKSRVELGAAKEAPSFSGWIQNSCMWMGAARDGENDALLIELQSIGRVSQTLRKLKTPSHAELSLMRRRRLRR